MYKDANKKLRVYIRQGLTLHSRRLALYKSPLR